MMRWVNMSAEPAVAGSARTFCGASRRDMKSIRTKTRFKMTMRKGRQQKARADVACLVRLLVVEGDRQWIRGVIRVIVALKVAGIEGTRHHVQAGVVRCRIYWHPCIY